MTTNTPLKELILSIDPDAAITEESQYFTAVVAPEKLHEVAQNLKGSPAAGYDYLISLTGVDYPDQLLGVVYHLASTKHRDIMVLKTSTADRETPTIDTVSDIWKTANFHEREVFDLLGIRFNNHPDLRRIFLEEDWVGFPLRKDYKDDVNIVER